MTAFKIQQVTTPVLIHLLSGEVRFPRLFLLRCKLTLPRFKRRIDRRFPNELIELAALPIWIYINLKQRNGQRKAFEALRIANLTGGVASWNIAYKTAQNERNFASLCDAELEVNQSGITRWNTLEVVTRSAQHFEIKVTRCLFHELNVSLGVPELTPVICQIDNAAFNSYLPDRITFDRGRSGKRISDGAAECRFVWKLND